jgi:hypothetical protein
MKRVVLERFLATTHGVFGVLTVDGYHLFTCEEEDLGNRVGVSCIPPGLYLLRRTVYQKYGYETFEVTDVPGRTRILFHPGNTEEDTEGCILVGLSLGVLDVKDEDSGERAKKLAVLSSRKAFNFFMEKLAGKNEVELVIAHYATEL